MDRITGDHLRTAVLTGLELDQLSDDALAAAVLRTSVSACVAPKHKRRIVQALQASGDVVAMTGDAVNDALR